MKKLFCIFLLLFCFNTSFAQILSLKDLLKISEMTIDEFHVYASAKKYKFYQVEDDENIGGFSYAYGQNRSNKYATRVVSKFRYKKTKKHSVSYQTLTSGDYFSINGQLAPLGFQFINSRIGKAGTKFLMYRKGKTEVSLSSDQGINAYGEKTLFYQVLVSSY